MAGLILAKFDRILNYVSILVILGGSTVIHTLTALAIRGYYGDPWGYVAFLSPGVAEAYLAVMQLGDQQYNYTILLTCFFTLTAITGLLWILKKIIKTKLQHLTEISA